MAKNYGTSDLGSDWITVPRKFRGRKPTSSDTHLAYITRPEMKALGLLSQAKKMQVGPADIPSFDDSGFTYDKESDYDKRYEERKKSAWKPKETVKAPTSIFLGKGVGTKAIKSPAQNVKDRGITKKNPYGIPETYGVKQTIKKAPKINIPDKDDDDGGTTPDPCQGRGRNPDGSCKEEPTTGGDKCAGKSLTCPSDRPKGQGVCDPATGNVDFSSCAEETSPCTYGKNPDGSCKEKPGGEDEDGDAPSLTTILKPDQTPMLQTLTNEMDLRNMLSNVLNKNNPLFKQARTRALQAMAGRGIVNSSMAEEAVMGAIMNVAMPIATRVIDDMQRVMAANVNASNAFKQALNEAYYSELIKRVDAANEWNLNKMLQSQEWARSMLTAKAGAANIKEEDAFKRYMDMLSGKTYGNI